MRPYFNADVKNLKNLENSHNKFIAIQDEKTLKLNKTNKLYETNILIKENCQPTQQLWDINPSSIFNNYFNDTTNFDSKQEIQSEKISSNKKIKYTVYVPGSTNIFSKLLEEKSNKQMNKDIKKLVSEKVKEYWIDVKNEEKIAEEDRLAQLEILAQQAVKVVDDPEEQKTVEKEQKTNENPIQKKIYKQNFQKSKGANFVRLDLKRTYQEKYRGQLYINKTFFNKNGKRKNPKDQKEDNEIGKPKIPDFSVLNTSQSNNNIYLQSISPALIVDLLYEGRSEQEAVQENQDQYDLSTYIKDQVLTLQNGQNRDATLVRILSKVFGFSNFRECQSNVILDILDKKSILMVQKTGFGKSLTYQMLSLLYGQGFGLVFCPLISLMFDQITKLPKVLPAAAYHSMLTSNQKQKIQQFLREDKIRLLFCTPEIFQSELAFLIQSFGKCNFVVIDEVHCVSELSHNFRPTYLVLNQMLKQFLEGEVPPYLTLTATATLKTTESIQQKFKIDNLYATNSTIRNNLIVTVSRDKEPLQGLIKLVQSSLFQQLNSIIIYARSRWMVDTIGNYLSSSGFNAKSFHAGLTELEKITIQNDFMNNRLRIVVATSIFAMGIDKANVRAVIHIQMPRCMESYLQEIGRAGRDDQIAYCHLFLHENDFHTERSFIISDFPDKILIHRLLTLLKNKVKAADPDEAQTEKQPNKILFLNTKLLEKGLDLKKDTIFTLLRYFEKHSNKITVYPTCPEKIVLKFFKTSVEVLAEKDEFIATLLQIGQLKNGALHIGTIKASNFMHLHPLDLVKKCKYLFQTYFITSENVDEVFPFSMRDLDEDEEDQLLGLIFEEVEFFKSHSLEKLNYIYLSTYEHSFYSIDQALEVLQNIEDPKLQQQKKHFYFDLYFNQKEPYQELLNHIIQDSSIVDEILPFDVLDEGKKEHTIRLIYRFIKEETVLLGRPEEKKQKLAPFIKDPKILARLLCGISSINYPYTEWKKTLLWGVSKRHKYEEVYNLVLELLAERQGSFC